MHVVMHENVLKTFFKTIHMNFPRTHSSNKLLKSGNLIKKVFNSRRKRAYCCHVMHMQARLLLLHVDGV
jgi:hypothetical protein